jgi:rhodanese-related sulfurtransferase
MWLALWLACAQSDPVEAPPAPATPPAPAAATFTTIQVQDFAGLDPKPVLVDVRTAEEFAGGHLPGAINLPMDQVADRHGELQAGQPVAVVCAVGGRSAKVSEQLVGLGFTDVTNLDGGTNGWRALGLPIEMPAE